jgi:hypothetical protein
MSRRGTRKPPPPLDRRALELARRKYGLNDPFVAHGDRGVVRQTREPVHRFRVASLANANAPHHVVLLDDAGDEVDLARLRDIDFPTLSAPGAPVPAGRPAAPAEAIGISPSENHLVLKQGDTHDETVVVTIPPDVTVPRADVYFLADTTGSMTDVLAAVQAGANTILSALRAVGLDLRFGVGNYKDFPGDPFAFQHQLNPTSVVAQVTSAINAWSASGGGDTAEGQFFAFHRLAEAQGGSIGWRSAVKRIVVWFGDAPAHDPVCAAIAGLAGDVTEASVTGGLVAERIVVLAISVSNPGLDADPRPISSDYQTVCGAPGGAAGQATRIATATGGQFTAGIDPGTIVTTIVDMVKAAVSQIDNVRLVAAGATAPFVTSITPPAGYGPLPTDRAHRLEFRVTFTGTAPCRETEQVFHGALNLVVDDVPVAQKPVEITVPACIPRYSYSVKFVCGRQPECPCECVSVRPGVYATEINVYNHHSVDVEIEKRVIPVTLLGAPGGREPRLATARPIERITLPAHSATMDDCCRIAEVLLGGPAPAALPLTVGFLEITSARELSVTAIHTATDLKSGSPSIRVAQIQGRRLTSSLVRAPRGAAPTDRHGERPGKESGP